MAKLKKERCIRERLLRYEDATCMLTDDTVNTETVGRSRQGEDLETKIIEKESG